MQYCGLTIQLNNDRIQLNGKRNEGFRQQGNETMKTLEQYTRIARQYAPVGIMTASARQWYELGRQRQERRFSNRDPLPTKHGQMIVRFIERNRQMFEREIARRGFDTTIEEKNRTVELKVWDRKDGLWLLNMDGWRHYSNRFGARHTSVSYLCGVDDNGPWAVRVPGTILTVDEALEYTIPADVRKAAQAGKRVVRQGDVFAIELKRDGDHALPRGHRFNSDTRTLVHEGGHEAVAIPFPCKFIVAQGLAPRRAYRRSQYWD
jgi:hypothetical protein